MKRVMAALLAAAAASCSSSPAPPDPPPVRPPMALPEGDLCPLDPGRSWEYVGAHGERHVHRVARTEIVRRSVCAVVERVSGRDVERLWLRREPTGVVQVRAQDGELAPVDYEEPVVHVPIPAAVGRTWEYEVPTAAFVVRFTGSVEGVEDVTVPAGTFRCARIRTVGRVDRVTLTERVAWYSPGTGLVQEESMFDAGSGPIHGRIQLVEVKR